MTETHLLYALLIALVILGLWYGWRWYSIERKYPSVEPRRPRLGDSAVGFVTNFFDTLGIGSFATTTAAFKFQRRMPDEQIPGTLNAGYALATIVQALIFIYLEWDAIDPKTLVLMIGGAVLGSWLGAGIVARLPRRAIQIGLGFALLVAAGLFLGKATGWTAASGLATGLTGGKLVVGVGMNFVLGALMTIGLGLYGPCLILVSLLGMDPHLAFPIMMGSCAFLMPACAIRFVGLRKYCSRAAIGMTVGAIPAVLIAAPLVSRLKIQYLYWLVLIVALYASTLMLFSAFRRSPAAEHVPAD